MICSVQCSDLRCTSPSCRTTFPSSSIDERWRDLCVRRDKVGTTGFYGLAGGGEGVCTVGGVLVGLTFGVSLDWLAWYRTWAENSPHEIDEEAGSDMLARCLAIEEVDLKIY